MSSIIRILRQDEDARTIVHKKGAKTKNSAKITQKTPKRILALRTKASNWYENAKRSISAAKQNSENTSQ